jgi:5-methylcytosine-specific restriction protein A
MGGTRRPETNSPSNLLVACYHCHRTLIESKRDKALENGWLVKQSEDPETVPVLLFIGWRKLTIYGAYASI